MVKVNAFDVVEYLEREGMIEEYLAAAKECENPDISCDALSDVAKSSATRQRAIDAT